MLKLLDESDEYLLAEISKKNRKAFNIIYDRHWKMIFSEVCKRTRNINDSKDIVQDVFLQLWLRDEKAPIKNIKAYLFVIARNNVFKYLKEKAQLLSQQLSTPIENDHDSADSKIILKESIELFNLMVEQLPLQQKTIFKMRYQQDIKSDNIAEMMGLSAKTVRNQLGRSLKKIKAHYFPILLFISKLLWASRFGKP